MPTVKAGSASSSAGLGRGSHCAGRAGLRAVPGQWSSGPGALGGGNSTFA